MTKLKQQNLENAIPVTRQALWEKLLDQGYVISPPTTTVSAHWLYEGENRLDGGYYGSNAQTATRIVNDCGYPVERLGNLTQEIFILGRFKRIYATNKQAGYPYLGASEALQFRPISERYLAKDHLPKKPQKHFVKKDWILMSCSGTVGRAVMTTKRLEQFFLTHDLARIVPKESPFVGYLYAFLSSWIGKALITKDQYGSAIKHLEPHHIAGVPVPIISESQQKIIHQEIIRAYQLREVANQLLDEADELLHEALGLPYFDESLVEYLPRPQDHNLNRPQMPSLKAFTTQLSELGDRFDCSYHIPVARTAVKLLNKAVFKVIKLRHLVQEVFIPFRFKRVYVSKKYGSPFFLPSQITQIKFWEKKYLSNSANTKNINSCKLHEGWLVISRSGTVGKTMYISHYLNGWIGSDDLLRVIPDNKKCHAGFLYSFLNSPYGSLQMNAAIYGAVIGHLEEHHLHNIMIPHPPLDIQIDIGEKVVTAFEYREEANLIEEQAINLLEQILQQKITYQDEIEKKSKPIWESFNEFTENLPEEVTQDLPTDSAANLDYYLYGNPNQVS
ncbi:MAG: restriction endonuclease subunit S [Microcystaceae cyanobacterium]